MVQEKRSEAPIGMFTTNSDLEIQIWDAALERMTGITAGAARGRSLIDVVPDLEGRRLLARFNHVIEDGVVEVLATAFHHYLIPCVLPEPSPFRFMQQRVTIAPLREGSRIAGALVTIEDVTGRLLRERALAKQLNDPSVQVRIDAAKTLAEENDLEPSGTLLRALSNSSWQVRRIAADGLATRGAPDAIAALLESLRDNHFDFGLLNSALQVLRMSEIDTTSPLLEFLNDSDSDLRMQAALVLGDQGATSAVPALTEHALSDPDVNVQYHSIEALGKLHAVDAVEALTTIAETRDFFVAFPALEALGATGDSRIAPRIVPLLGDEKLREAAADALSHIGDEEIVAPLAALLTLPDAPTTTVANALAGVYFRYQQTLGEGEYIADLSRQAITPAGIQNLLEALDHETGNDLHNLAIVTGWLRGAAVARALTRLLGKPLINAEIIEALVRHGSGVTEILIEQLDAEDLDLRKAAIVALGRIGDRRATAQLTQFLAEDPELAIVAANALAQIGDDSAFEDLISILGHQNPAVRQAAIAALNSIGSVSMPARMMSLMSSDDPNVRESAVRISGYFGYPECAELLLDRCHDENERVSRAAIENIAYLDDDRAEGELLSALGSDRERIRAAAASAIWMVDSEERLPSLVSALNDPDSWVRYFAARSLGKLATTESLSALSESANSDPANHVRIAAIEAIGHTGGPKSVQAIDSFVDASDPNISDAAILALGHINSNEARSKLLKTLKMATGTTRINVLRSLAYYPDPFVVEQIQIVVATETERAVWQAGIEALRRIGTAEAIGALVGFSADAERQAEVKAALAHSAESMFEEIALGLKPDRAVEIRRAVVDVLARIRNPSATVILERAVNDSDAAVRRATRRYLRAAFHRMEHVPGQGNGS